MDTFLNLRKWSISGEKTSKILKLTKNISDCHKKLKTLSKTAMFNKRCILPQMVTFSNTQRTILPRLNKKSQSIRKHENLLNLLSKSSNNPTNKAQQR